MQFRDLEGLYSDIDHKQQQLSRMLELNLQQIRRENQDQLGKVDSTHGELEALRSDLGTLTGQLDELGASQTALNVETGAFKALYTEYERRLDEQQGIIRSLEQRLDSTTTPPVPGDQVGPASRRPAYVTPQRSGPHYAECRSFPARDRHPAERLQRPHFVWRLLCRDGRGRG